MPAETLLARIFGLQRMRDNIMYALAHQELSDDQTVQLETQLSSVEDELVRLQTETLRAA